MLIEGVATEKGKPSERAGRKAIGLSSYYYWEYGGEAAGRTRLLLKAGRAVSIIKEEVP